MAKKLNTDLDKSKKKIKKEEEELNLSGFTVVTDGEAEEVEEDITAYQMGNILVDEGNSDDGEADVQQLMSGVKKKGEDDDEDDEDGEVWVSDLDVFDATDPILDAANSYDPDNEGYDDE